MKYLFYSFLYVLTLYFLIASNASIGQASYENEPWKYLYLFCFVSQLLIPCSAILLVLKSRSMGVEYKQRLQNKLNISLILIVALAFLAELSLTPKTNIRLDLLLVVPAFFIHIVVYLIYTFRIKNRERNI
ncbi:hypothetical protein AN214_02043 [Pseudoalteromonas sp. P1-9]|uniref:hypothetical protein n=1 Tax=Pseudoalteromonas sp. P1-9 TaxID=1710354 RepID=UPI000707883B|nr:hypothetical protein [Pseudoalteromonas sp. P1-9]KPV95849.1 hypothetical protein AN214_02043 [Pseudoalteromonas sp. P1-9]